jgi:peptidyl-prolyl cis-trans isomerase SurA
MHQAAGKQAPATRPDVDSMNLRIFRAVAFIAFGLLLAMWPTLALGQVNEPESPYGGSVVEDIIARVNDEIITKSDYDRAESELDQEGQKNGASMQEMATQRKELLRNLIDQQLWLSKGKELDITGETELVKRLDEIRKQNNLDSIEDLEKAAKDQGVSFEDFKANIRNQIITQEVMRQEVGEHIQMTPGEVERYYEAHKQEYAQQESVRLSEILVSTGTPAPDVQAGATQGDDPAKLAAAKAKADDIEAKLHAGGDFSLLAKSFSDGQTAAQGGDLGEYRRGALAKVLEDQTFSLKSGQWTEPVRTRQGYVILKVDQHIPGGIPPYKDVQEQVADAYYMTRMAPAIRDYLTQMREDGYVQILKPSYVDTGASAGELKQSISYSAYTAPTPKKKKKVERTRFRETARGFRQKSPQNAAAEPPPAPAPQKQTASAEKPGKKEKIRFGQAPTTTLPKTASPTVTEDAGAVQVAGSGEEPVNPLENAPAPKKSRFSDRLKAPKQPKPKGPRVDAQAPAPPDAGEVADRQTQSAPLGPTDPNAKKKKSSTTTASEKTRLSDKKKQPDQQAPAQPTPIPAVPGAPAPAPQTQAPAPAPQQ